MIYNPQTGWQESQTITESSENMIDYVSKLQLANHHLNEAIGLLSQSSKETKSSLVKQKIQKLGGLIIKIREQGIPSIINTVSKYQTP